MKKLKFDVTAYPRAVLDGVIYIPENLTSYDERCKYVSDHWDEIDFAEPDFEFDSCTFDITPVKEE